MRGGLPGTSANGRARAVSARPSSVARVGPSGLPDPPLSWARLSDVPVRACRYSGFFVAGRVPLIYAFLD